MLFVVWFCFVLFCYFNSREDLHKHLLYFDIPGDAQEFYNDITSAPTTEENGRIIDQYDYQNMFLLTCIMSSEICSK